MKDHVILVKSCKLKVAFVVKKSLKPHVGAKELIADKFVGKHSIVASINAKENVMKVLVDHVQEILRG